MSQKTRAYRDLGGMWNGSFPGRAHGGPRDQQHLQLLRSMRGSGSTLQEMGCSKAFLPVEFFSLSVPADRTHPTKPPGTLRPDPPKRSLEHLVACSRMHDCSLHASWQVSQCLRNPKQRDSVAQADTTAAVVTSGRDSSPGTRLEGQGQFCS